MEIALCQHQERGVRDGTSRGEGVWKSNAFGGAGEIVSVELLMRHERM
jgi:hypothetical protein